jgi:hypothetical protein
MQVLVFYRTIRLAWRYIGVTRLSGSARTRVGYPRNNQKYFRFKPPKHFRFVSAFRQKSTPLLSPGTAQAHGHVQVQHKSPVGSHVQVQHGRCRRAPPGEEQKHTQRCRTSCRYIQAQHNISLERHVKVQHRHVQYSTNFCRQHSRLTRISTGAAKAGVQ